MQPHSCHVCQKMEDKMKQEPMLAKNDQPHEEVQIDSFHYSSATLKKEISKKFVTYWGNF